MRSSYYFFLDRIFLLVFLLCCLSSCAGSGDSDSIDNSDPDSANFTEKVVNGVALAGSDYPQIVRIDITFADGEAGICSGTIISKRAVLTAAHCLFSSATNAPLASGIIRPGVGQPSYVSAAYYDSGYRVDYEIGALFNDAAILFSDRDFSIVPLNFLASRAVTAGESLFVIGYGLTEDGNVGALQGGPTAATNVSPNHIMVNYDGTGANSCQGDSGGPLLAPIYNNAGLIAQFAIVGIVSSGTNPNCEAGDFSLYTNTQTPSILNNFVLSLVPEAGLI